MHIRPGHRLLTAAALGALFAPLPTTAGEETRAADTAGFDSGLLQNGERWTHTFAQVGTLEYFCRPHPYMRGTVTVVAYEGETNSTSVRIVGFKFAPANITVPQGTTIEWTNEDTVPHSVTQASSKGSGSNGLLYLIVAALALVGVAVFVGYRLQRR